MQCVKHNPKPFFKRAWRRMSVAAAVRESGGSGARAWRRKRTASTGAAGRPLLLIARLITIIGRLGGRPDD
jgi:hypothetical protein